MSERTAANPLVATGAARRCQSCSLLLPAAEFLWTMAHLDRTDHQCRVCVRAGIKRDRLKRWRRRQAERLAIAVTGMS